MSRNKLLYVAALAASVYAWPGIAAADLATGLSAYQSGDYATALKELKPLVDAGDFGATNTLAVMYAHGRGVPKDATKAISLYRLAAEAARSPLYSLCWPMIGHPGQIGPIINVCALALVKATRRILRLR